MSLFPNGKEVPDTIWFGYVQGLDEEWGYFSQAEIEIRLPGRFRKGIWFIREEDKLNILQEFHQDTTRLIQFIEEFSYFCSI